jgi:peptide-methionine (S)-S-oxide reductase
MNPETAILGGGCFWGMQDLLRRYSGVISSRVGYTGGDVPTPPTEIIATMQKR